MLDETFPDILSRNKLVVSILRVLNELPGSQSGTGLDQRMHRRIGVCVKLGRGGVFIRPASEGDRQARGETAERRFTIVLLEATGLLLLR